MCRGIWIKCSYYTLLQCTKLFVYEIMTSELLFLVNGMKYKLVLYGLFSTDLYHTHGIATKARHILFSFHTTMLRATYCLTFTFIQIYV